MNIVEVIHHQISFRLLYTQLIVQSMEYIFGIWYYLFPFLLQCGPYCILVIVVSNRVVFFLDNIPKRIRSGGDDRYCRFISGPFLTVSFPPILNMGDKLKCLKSNIFSIEKVMDRKITFYNIKPFIYNICIYLAFK
jgi:hypothetical protein